MPVPLFPSWLTLLAALLLATAPLTAQVDLEHFPADYQLVPRAPGTALGTYEVRGTVTQAGVAEVRVELSDGGGTVFAQAVALTYQGGAAPFTLPVEIPARRAEHTLRVYLDGDQTPVATAEHLLAGDVFVVNGQSNAVANFAIDPSDRDTFLRGFVAQRGWSPIQFANPGQWMGHAAATLSRERDIPLALFNYAVGGEQVRTFLPDSAGGGGNFEAALADLRRAEVIEGVRAFFWYQGESDGAREADYYRDAVLGVWGAYREALGPVPIYGFQVRAYSCDGILPDVMDVQRRLSDSLDYVTYLATTHTVQRTDSCHYDYVDGHQTLGRRLADLLAVREYGATLRGVESPRLDSARVTAAQVITLYFDTGDTGVAMASSGTPWGDFTAGPAGVAAVRGVVKGTSITLEFDDRIDSLRTVSYIAPLGPTSRAIHNDRGVGAFTFVGLPVGPLLPVTGIGPDATSAFSDLAARLRLGPNPVAVGATFSLELPVGGPWPVAGAAVSVATLDGKTVGNATLRTDAAGRLEASAPTRPGVYVVRVGPAARLLVVR